MPTLLPSDEDLEKERNKLRARPFYVAQTPELPLNLLSDRDFELLAYELLNAEMPVESYDRVSPLPLGADKGRDVILYLNQRPVGVIQCKRYARTIGLQLVLSEILKLALFAVRNPKLLPQSASLYYEFWTAKDITDDARRFFDEKQDRLPTARALAPGLTEKLRRKYESFKTPPAGMTPEEEVDAALDLMAKFQFRHVHGVDISKRLNEHPQVRRLFFRGPEDVSQKASTQEVERLMADVRQEQLKAFRRTGKAGHHPYIRPIRVNEQFTEFLQSGANVMIVTGGSGHGKTTWCARLLEKPPIGVAVDFVRVDDLESGDVTVVSTIARSLQGRPMRGVSSMDLADAVWEWLDQTNRLIIIDGLDRVRENARETLPNWLRQTIQFTERAPVRFLITSRPEAWAEIQPQIPEVQADLYNPRGENASSHEMAPPVVMGLLDRQEAAAMYEAYGLRPEEHGGRLFRTPSLISTFASLKAGGGEDPVTRLDIFRGRVEQAINEMGRRTGRTKSKQAIHQLARLLGMADDGRVPLEDLTQTVDGDVIDELIKTNLFVTSGVHGMPWSEEIRPESDEVLEYLWGCELDPGEAIEEVRGGRGDPLFLGALAMATALAERENPAQAEELLATLVAEAKESDIAFEAAARVAAELAKPASVKSQLSLLFRRWHGPNLVLAASNLGELIDSLRLPPVEHLELLLLLPDGEDSDDWRVKFWLDANAEGRWFTPFAMVAMRVARSAGADALELLRSHRGKPEPVCSVVRGLLLEAVSGSPEAALRQVLSWPHDPRDSLRDHLARRHPTEFAKALASVTNEGQLSPEEAADCLWDVSNCVNSPWPEVPVRTGNGDAAIEAIDSLAETLLLCVKEQHLRAKLIICRLRKTRSAMLEDELWALYEQIEPSDLWPAFAVAGRHQRGMLRRLIDDVAAGGPHRNAFSMVGVSEIPPEHWAELVKLLEPMLDSDKEAVVACAAALETLLRAAECNGQVPLFLPLAMRVARSSIAEARRFLIYFAGSETRRHPRQTADQIAARDALFSELVASEDGETLELVIRKILESAHERPEPLSQLLDLSRRLGPDLILEEIQKQGIIAEINGTGWLLQQFETALNDDAPPPQGSTDWS